MTTVRNRLGAPRACERVLPVSIVALALLTAAVLASCGSPSQGAAVTADTAQPGLSKVTSTDVDLDGRAEIVVSSATDAPRVFSATSGSHFEDSSATLSDAASAVLSSVPDIGEALLDFLPFGEEGAPTGVVLFECAETEEVAGAPTITAVQPAKSEPGDVLWISGTGFHTKSESADVLLGTRALAPIFVLSRFLAVQVPLDVEPGKYDIVVRRGEFSSETTAVEVVAVAAPEVARVLPDPLIRGRIALIEGSHLGRMGEETTVSIGGVQAKSVLSLRNVVMFTVPGTAGDGDLIVTRTGMESTPVAVSVSDAAPLSISDVVPAKAPTGALVLVELAGLDFGSFGPSHELRATLGRQELPLLGVDPRGLLVLVPAGASSGDLTVTVGDATTNTFAFVVRDREAPAIDSVEPDPIEAGGVALIKGRDLYDLDVEDIFSTGVHTGPSLGATVLIDGQASEFVFPTEQGLITGIPLSLEPGSDGAVSVVVRVDGTDSEPKRVQLR